RALLARQRAIAAELGGRELALELAQPVEPRIECSTTSSNGTGVPRRGNGSSPGERSRAFDAVAPALAAYAPTEEVANATTEAIRPLDVGSVRSSMRHLPL